MHLNSSDYLHLNIGKLGLLLPVSEIVSLESSLDIVSSHTSSNKTIPPGSILLGGKSWPVFFLGDRLEITDQPGRDGKICVCLSDATEIFGFVCDQIQKLPEATVTIVDLPDCMQLPDSPVRALAIRDKQVFCIIGAAELHKYIKTFLAEITPRQPDE